LNLRPLDWSKKLRTKILQVIAAALHAAANPEKDPRLQLMLADLFEVIKCCEKDLVLYQQ
jgi:hypothetical protein